LCIARRTAGSAARRSSARKAHNFSRGRDAGPIDL
jgi:hypothetical protein